MSIGRIIKKIREDKGLMQKEISSYLNIGNSNYRKSTTVDPYSLQQIIRKAYGK